MPLELDILHTQLLKFLLLKSKLGQADCFTCDLTVKLKTTVKQVSNNDLKFKIFFISVFFYNYNFLLLIMMQLLSFLLHEKLIIFQKRIFIISWWQQCFFNCSWRKPTY